MRVCNAMVIILLMSLQMVLIWLNKFAVVFYDVKTFNWIISKLGFAFWRSSQRDKWNLFSIME